MFLSSVLRHYLFAVLTYIIIGESALHFAVVHGNLESVKLLVEKGAIVNQRATGRFFLPEDQKPLSPATNTNYDGRFCFS